MPSDTVTYVTAEVCEPPTCSADLNCDSIRGATDVLIMISCFGLNDGGDVYGNGTTDIADLVYLLSKFGYHCDGTDLQD